MDTKQIVAELGREIARLSQVRALLTGSSNNNHTPSKHWAMSADGRNRVAAAQRKRWAKAKRLKKSIEKKNRYVDMRYL
jgi:hypothetical protein